MRIGMFLCAVAMTATAGAVFSESLSIAIRGPLQPVRAHGSFVFAYEVDIFNHTSSSAVLTRLETFGENGPALFTYEKSDLERNGIQFAPKPGPLRLPLAPDVRAVIFCWIEVTVDTGLSTLRHRLTYTISQGKEENLEVSTPVKHSTPIVLGPPLTSGDWWVANGASNTSEHHRGQVRINGNPDAPFAQRYAIDWVRFCDGNWMRNKGKVNTNFCGYSAPVIAVSDAAVASVKDDIPDNMPGEDSRSVKMTLETILGNYVILDLGAQTYAVYAHLQPGSIEVKPGMQVRRGDVLGHIGNSGNSDAPHLHFHVAQGPSIESITTVQSNPIPYVIDRFEWRGTYNGKGTAAATATTSRSSEIPVEGDIIRFLQ